ncbi:MAG: Yip1 family protein [Acidobacteriota bacterium]
MTDERSGTPTEPDVSGAASGEPVPEAKPVGGLEGMAGMLTAPAATFRRIAEKPGKGFLVPLILFVLVSAAASLVFIQRADLEQVMRDQIRQSPRSSQMTEAQMDQGVRMGTKIAKLGPYIGFAVILIKFLIVAAVLWLVVLAFGDVISFGNSFRVVCWAQVPTILFTLLWLVTMFVRDPTYLDPQNPVASNLGALLGQDRLGKPLYALLSDLDIFTIWMLWLYTRGLQAFTKARVGKMASIVFGLFCLPVAWHLVKAILF